MDTPLVLVAGAGPTGMTAAIELKRLGLDVRIIDKSDHLAQHSQALVMQARTLEQLQRYGLADAAVASGRKIKHAEFFSDGKKLGDISLSAIPSRYPFALMLPQTETEALLNQHMESLGVKAERDIELVSIASQPSGVDVTLRHADGSEERIQPRWVIGCDGAHSTIRQQTGVPFSGAGIPLNFFLGDFELSGPDVPVDQLSIHIHHGNFIFMARLTESLTRIIIGEHVAAKEAQNTQPAIPAVIVPPVSDAQPVIAVQPAGDVNTDAGLKRQLTLQDFQNAADFMGARIHVNRADWMTPFSVNDRIATHYRIGNIFLAGDASHIHSPAGGQGMNTGMQDVANLAWKLAAVTAGADDKLLDSYEEERIAVGKNLLASTERMVKLVTSTNTITENLRDTLLPILSKLHPVQHRILGFISETAIEYRGSSAVVDRGGSGELHAGDRMPDLPLLNYEGTPSLLSNWTKPGHLAVLLDAEGDEAAQFAASFPAIQTLSIHIADLGPHGRHLVGEDAKLFIVRPDGYIGYRGRIEQRYFWEFYGEHLGLAPFNHDLMDYAEELSHP
jgi:2-polyprenyl-6-methoxyphenol hydroxylase-like FAD-dependent oxidoreductase